jgi:hypothetical protein
MRSQQPKPSPGPDDQDGDRNDTRGDSPDPLEEPDEDAGLDDYDLPCTDADDARWDVFIPDDDERDPLPDPRDFCNAEFSNDE